MWNVLYILTPHRYLSVEGVGSNPVAFQQVAKLAAQATADIKDTKAEKADVAGIQTQLNNFINTEDFKNLSSNQKDELKQAAAILTDIQATKKIKPEQLQQIITIAAVLQANLQPKTQGEADKYKDDYKLVLERTPKLNDALQNGVDKAPPGALGEASITTAMWGLRRDLGSHDLQHPTPIQQAILEVLPPEIKGRDLTDMLNPDKPMQNKVAILRRLHIEDPGKVLTAMVSVTQAFVEAESNRVYANLGGQPPLPQNMILATGDGSGTKGIMPDEKGNDNSLGIGLFAYSFKDNGDVKPNNAGNFKTQGNDWTNLHLNITGVNWGHAARNDKGVHIEKGDQQYAFDVKPGGTSPDFVLPQAAKEVQILPDSVAGLKHPKNIRGGEMDPKQFQAQLLSHSMTQDQKIKLLGANGFEPDAAVKILQQKEFTPAEGALKDTPSDGLWTFKDGTVFNEKTQNLTFAPKDQADFSVKMNCDDDEVMLMVSVGKGHDPTTTIKPEIPKVELPDNFALGARDNFAPDEFSIHGTLKVPAEDLDKLSGALKDPKVGIAPSSLHGEGIGMKTGANQVVKDPAGSAAERPQYIGDRDQPQYKDLRYSQVQINVKDNQVGLDVSSFVDPVKSNLDGHFKGKALDTYHEFVKTPVTNNDMLSALRTFALLEKVRDEMSARGVPEDKANQVLNGAEVMVGGKKLDYKTYQYLQVAYDKPANAPEVSKGT